MSGKCRIEINKWLKCGLSWLGRVHAVKMTLLPRLLYLFRSLPIPIKKSFLRKLQSDIISFVWSKRGYRCPSNILLRLKSQGGVGLPDLWAYYQAAQLAQLYMIFSQGSKPDWLAIERRAMPHHTLDYLLWCNPKIRPAIMSPTLSHSISLSTKLFRQNSLTSSMKPLAHIFHNSEFPPGINIKAFKW